MSADQNDADKIANALASYQQPRAMVSRGVQELIRAPALWDLKRLETEVRANGFQAVTAQLRGATGFDRVDTYLRILEFDTFAHRNGVPEELPGLFLQTVRNRAFQLGEFGVQHEAEKLLTDRGLSHLAAVRRTGPENPNTVRIVERARLSTFGPERIFTIVAHGDGGEYIVGYEAGMVESWNAQTGSRVWAVQIQGLTGLAVSEATSSLVTSSRAGYLGRRDLSTGADLGGIDTGWGHTENVSLAKLGNLALAWAGNRIGVWDLTSGQVETEVLTGDLTKDAEVVRSAIFNDDDSVIIALLEHNMPWPDDYGYGEVNCNPDKHYFSLVRWHWRQGQVVVLAKFDHKPTSWLLHRELNCLLIEQDQVISRISLSNGRTQSWDRSAEAGGLAACATDGALVTVRQHGGVRLCSAASGEATGFVPGPVDVPVVVLGNSGLVVANTPSGICSLRILDGQLRQGRPRQATPVPLMDARATTILMSPTGRWFLTATRYFAVVWDLETGNSANQLGIAELAGCYDLNPLAINIEEVAVNGNSSVVTLGIEWSVRDSEAVWDEDLVVSKARAQCRWDWMTNTLEAVSTGVSISRESRGNPENGWGIPDRPTSGSGTAAPVTGHYWNQSYPSALADIESRPGDNGVEIYDAFTGKLITTLNHADNISGAAITLCPRRYWLAAIFHDGTLGLWRVQTGERITSLDIGRWISICCFTVDSQRIVTIDHLGDVGIWKINSP